MRCVRCADSCTPLTLCLCVTIHVYSLHTCIIYDAISLSAVQKWAACAVGRFAVSYSDVLASGMERGTAVEVLHHLDDALWSSGDTSEPTSAQPPPEAAAAVSAYRQRLAAVAAAEEQVLNGF
jgi:hypothetical protein